MSKKIDFLCDKCGKESSTWESWFKKRKNHYCSRSCKDAHFPILHGFGMDRKQYEKWYWSQPKNALRRKSMAKDSHRRRNEEMGDSLKKQMVLRCKARAAKRGIPFGLSYTDFDIPERCPILGVNLSVGDKQGGSPFSPSLDRIIPSLGYVRGNVMVISKRANTIKSDATAEELLAVAKFIAGISQTEDQQ